MFAHQSGLIAKDFKRKEKLFLRRSEITSMAILMIIPTTNAHLAISHDKTGLFVDFFLPRLALLFNQGIIDARFVFEEAFICNSSEHFCSFCFFGILSILYLSRDPPTKKNIIESNSQTEM